jgi:hypothetical protein
MNGLIRAKAILIDGEMSRFFDLKLGDEYEIIADDGEMSASDSKSVYDLYLFEAHHEVKIIFTFGNYPAFFRCANYQLFVHYHHCFF